MPVRLGHAVDARAGHAQQVDMHPHEHLVDDMQAAARQQRMDVRDPAVGAVLDRDHAQVGRARADRVDRILERGTGQGVQRRARLGAGLVAIGPQLPLERDPRHADPPVSDAARPGAIRRGFYTLRPARRTG